jgi:hypothetical protein
LATPARLAWPNNFVTPREAGVAVLFCHATVAGVARQRYHLAGVAKRFSFQKYFLERSINKIKK